MKNKILFAIVISIICVSCGPPVVNNKPIIDTSTQTERNVTIILCDFTTSLHMLSMQRIVIKVADLICSGEITPGTDIFLIPISEDKQEPIYHFYKFDLLDDSKSEIKLLDDTLTKLRANMPNILLKELCLDDSSIKDTNAICRNKFAETRSCIATSLEHCADFFDTYTASEEGYSISKKNIYVYSDLIEESYLPTTNGDAMHINMLDSIYFANNKIQYYQPQRTLDGASVFFRRIKEKGTIQDKQKKQSPENERNDRNVEAFWSIVMQKLKVSPDKYNFKPIR